MRNTRELHAFVQAAVFKLRLAKETPACLVSWGHSELGWEWHNFFLCDHFIASGKFEPLKQRFSETKRGIGLREFTQGGKIPHADYARRNQLRLEFLQRWAAKLEKEISNA